MIRVLEEAGRPKWSALTPRNRSSAPSKPLKKRKRCADLFKQHRDTHRRHHRHAAELRRRTRDRRYAAPGRLRTVPVLVQATPDTPGNMTIRDRRDSFCGKMSACNNLMQYGIPYSLTTLHTEVRRSPEFAEGSGLVSRRLPRRARPARACASASIGARPAAFNTVRYSEKLLEANGISVEHASIFPKSSAASIA